MNDAARNYAIVTASYWGFTLTDGALRMLVLFHFFTLGFSPFTLALLFLLYEVAGIVANLAGGWLATRFGIPRMLAAGQLLQIFGLILLSLLDPAWGAALAVVWVVVAQGIAGIAKDLTKTASKAAIKSVSSSDDTARNSALFGLVAWFTGSKNAMKGIGFFLGGLLLDTIGFAPALYALAGLIAVVLVAGIALLPRDLGRAKPSASIRELLAKTSAINTLALARVFLFSARDVWFVVGLPVFLYANGWTFWQVGGFLAAWTVAYGVMQAAAPRLISRSADGLSREVPAARQWAWALMGVTLAILALFWIDAVQRVDMLVAIALAGFGVAFAVNSSLHSYLILAYAGTRRAAEDVGFYYAANAVGRLAGTLLSGLLYQAGGLAACLVGATAMLAVCAMLTSLLPNAPERESRNREKIEV
ncbi:MAG: organoarsenical effux MFS transporter ArsJ [Pseudomonadota bacterium]